jgi:hypothetical protein
MPQMNPARTTIQEATDYVIRILGAAAANPVKQEGEGVVVTRTAPGVYRIQWAENPFQFVGAWASFVNTVPASTADFSITFGNYDSTNFRLEFSVFNAAAAPVDLTNAQRICVLTKFSRSGY